MENHLMRACGLAVRVAVTAACLSALSDSAHAACGTPANAVEAENCLPGNPSTEWDVVGDGDSSIQGFATDISVNRGQTVQFKVDTDAASYRIDIYRLGYYGGDGARKIATLTPSASLPQAQPACLTDASGLVDCGNWAVSAAWAVPANATSGIYIARLVRNDTQGASHVVFVVRHDGGTSDLLFQTADTTWQAYNRYGGNSLYVGTGPGGGIANLGRAYKVSYNRPFTTRAHSPEDWVFDAEYPMLRWLERNGYDVSYTTGVDTDRRAVELGRHKVFLSVGHDEYWSKRQFDNVAQARDGLLAGQTAPVHLAFLSGNEVFWKTRWEPSIDGSSTAYRTLVCYKETHEGAKVDPSPEWTGTWRDPRFSPPADGGRPENELTGTIFTVNGIQDDSIGVPAEYAALRFWRNTPNVSNLGGGQVWLSPQSTLGYEWDEDLDNGARPAGLVRLSSVTVNVPGILLDHGSTYGPGTATHSLVFHKRPSGALVFGAGTVRWSWGLDDDHDSPGTPTSVDMQQATVNLFADMGVQPATLQAGLVPASASSDVTPPASAITSPPDGTTVPLGTVVTLQGTASDSGGVVGGVEVSVDGGATWHPAAGRTSWSYAWTTTQAGTFTVRSRAVDDSGNIEAPGAGRNVTVAAPPPPSGFISIWAGTGTPAFTNLNDGQPINLGVKFRSSIAGYVRALRFYKGGQDTGTHVGRLWTASGTLLASATYVGETASGWQEVELAAPIPIAAGTTYVASYHSSAGYYVTTDNYFTQPYTNGPLTALADGSEGGNGLYQYGADAFPTQSYAASNYWVDVVFNTQASGPDTDPPAVLSTVPAGGATNVSVSANPAARFSEPLDPASVNGASVELRDAAGQLVPASVAWDPVTTAALLDPTASLASLTTYTATVKGGAGGVADVAGNPLPASVSWTFTTAPPPPSGPRSLWSGANVPNWVNLNDGQPIELGVKFQSSLPGYVTALRFYKGSQDTGTHVGNLWTASGTLLASATYTNGTASGWQQVALQAPVQIAADTTYVVSYHSAAGYYVVTDNYFVQAFVNEPLTALADGASGGNGVYRYGASGFPTGSYNQSNYWADVVFNTQPGAADTTPPTVTSTNPAGSATDVAVDANVTATFSEPLDPSKVNGTTFELRDGGGQLVPAGVTWNAAANSAVLDPTAHLANSTTYTATVKGGPGGVADNAGNALASDHTWTFTTVAAPSGLSSLWGTGGSPGFTNLNDGQPIEVGVKFRAAVAGYIRAIRFYKGSQDTGGHVGKLWSASGTLLASAAFTGESAAGWQEVQLAAPVAIAADTTYVASTFSDAGFYVVTDGYFTQPYVNGPLTALADGSDGANGVYNFGSPGFPTQFFLQSNYWVDAVFSVQASGADTAPPGVITTTPADAATDVSVTANVSARFSEPLAADTVNATAVELRTAGGQLVPATVTWDAVTSSAVVDPTGGLAYATGYTATVKGGAGGVSDPAGNALPADVVWTFTTQALPPPPPPEGPDGPILIISYSGNPFSRYLVEIVRAEGLNAYRAHDISTVDAALLSAYDVAILGEMPLNAAQVTLLSDWVNAGGNLIAMRPDKQLAGLFGLADGGSTLSNAYLQVDTGAAPGLGIVGQTVQFHGTADRYTLAGATAVAALYADATTGTPNPAVTLRAVGAAGGEAAAFTFDLARSIVYSRQGNPAWEGQKRDGQLGPIRSDDLYYGAMPGDVQPDWVNLDKVAIPQADELQRLLANLVLHVNRDRKPLPRFWYFPRGEKAVVVMTGDNHGGAHVQARLAAEEAASPAGCSVADWECVRSTVYVYPSALPDDATADAWEAKGFEIALHVNTDCANWTAATLTAFYGSQLASFAAVFPSLQVQATNRTHCIAWSDWATQPQVALQHGIRLDTNYYYWPDAWVGGRPGFFTGSGMPMRFADLDGTTIDVYQAATQMTDESGQSYPFTVDALLDRALGAEGYYGAFTTNIHADGTTESIAASIVSAAQLRGVPVVTARQMLAWLDGRDASAFQGLTWNAGTLSFGVAAGAGANGLQGLLPTQAGAAGTLATLARNGVAVPFTVEVVKGVAYAFFSAEAGSYQAVYAP